MQIDIQQAVKVFNNGGIVVFPTDTAYGIGCRIDSEIAVKRLFEIRRRPEKKATPVLVSDFEMAKEYWQEAPEVVVEKLVKPYWPGALTIVLKCRTEKVPGLVRGQGKTLGIRMPDHKDLRTIIQEVGVPVLAPSANFAGQPTPYKFEDLDRKLVKLVDYVVFGDTIILNEMKNLKRSFASAQDDIGQQPSTVIDCSVKPWEILRQGAIEISI